MAVNEYITLIDAKNMMAPGDARIASVCEIMAENNAIAEDVPFVKGNLATGMRVNIRTSMSEPTVRKFNQGVPASKSTVTTKTENIVIIEDKGYCDMRMKKVVPDWPAFLLSQNKPHINGLTKKFAEMMVYGDDPDGIEGFASRLGKLNGITGRQVIDAGGTTGDLQSVFFVAWDPDEAAAFYPMNSSTAGIDINTQENVNIPDPSTGDPTVTMLAHQSTYSWMVGMFVRNHKYIARLANIADDITNDELFRKLITTKNRIEGSVRQKAIMYMSGKLRTRLEIAAFEKSNANVGYKSGVENDTKVLSFSGLTVRENDCQDRKEAQVK